MHPPPLQSRAEGEGSRSLTKWPDVWFAAETAVIKHLGWTPLHRKFSTGRTRVLIIQNIPGVRHWVTICILRMFLSFFPPLGSKTPLTQGQQAASWGEMFASVATPGWCHLPQGLEMDAWERSSCTFTFLFFFEQAVEAGYNKRVLQTFFISGNQFYSFDKILPKGPTWKTSKKQSCSKGSGAKCLEPTCFISPPMCPQSTTWNNSK